MERLQFAQAHPGRLISGPPRWLARFDLDAVKKIMKRPANEPKSDIRYPVERERVKELTPPALAPHGVLGNSTSGFAYDSNGKFGPFKNQLLVCDQTFSVVNRGFLEKVNGVYQALHFRS